MQGAMGDRFLTQPAREYSRNVKTHTEGVLNQRQLFMRAAGAQHVLGPHNRVSACNLKVYGCQPFDS